MERQNLFKEIIKIEKVGKPSKVTNNDDPILVDSEDGKVISLVRIWLV